MTISGRSTGDGFSIDIDIYGEESAKRAILRPSTHVDDLRPVWPSIVKELTEIEFAQFATEGARSGRPWAQLELSTVNRKGNTNILRETDALLRSWIRLTHGNGAIRRLRKHDLEFSGQGYGFFHQHGRGVPQRRIVDLIEGDKRAIVKKMQRYIMTGEPE